MIDTLGDEPRWHQSIQAADIQTDALISKWYLDSVIRRDF